MPIFIPQIDQAFRHRAGDRMANGAYWHITFLFWSTTRAGHDNSCQIGTTNEMTT